VLSVSQTILGSTSVHEIDSRITQLQYVLSMSSLSDPSRPRFLVHLAEMRHHRHNLSNQNEDLDKSIVHLTESLLLPSISWLQHGRNILHTLSTLAQSLVMRANLSKQPEDLIYATKYLIHLRDQPVSISFLSRYWLVRALALQIELEAGNVMQNIREMIVLSRELLTLETFNVHTTHAIVLTCEVVLPMIHPLVPNQPLDELIEFGRMARKHRPDLLECRLVLARSLYRRNNMTFGSNDHEEITAVLDEILILTSAGDTQEGNAARRQATALLTGTATARWLTHPTSESLEEAIYRTRMYFDSPYPSFVVNPEAIAAQRFDYFGSTEGLGAEESFENSPLYRLCQQLHQLEFMLPESWRASYQMLCLSLEILNEDNATKIDEAVKKGRTILARMRPASNSPGDPPLFQGTLLNSFAVINFEAFQRTKKIEYLNESINVFRQVVESPFPQFLCFRISSLLSDSLLLRFQHFPGHRTQDPVEAMELLSQCVNNASESLPDRFQLACKWASVARQTRHPSLTLAYETGLALMQDALLFSPTLQLQHATLAMHDETHSLPLDFASHRIDRDQLEEAIEVLENGRALLWSEMRNLRASTDQLLEADPELGHKFAAVNRELEELTKSVPPSHNLCMDDAPADDLRAVDRFGRLVLTRRGLLMERAKLVSQIQSSPGFDTFLTSPSFETLRSAASSGPVIIINHSRWRSDIIVLLHNMPPSLIPTPDDFFERAAALKDKLLDSRRKSGLDSDDYDETLTLVLAELYRLVGKPVIDRLCQLQVPEQSRIWWCPTSAFSSLPLHAMGPIPSDDNDEPRYFLDLYICSYTPTLSALIQSRHHDSVTRSSDRPSVLLVAQPDPSLPTVGGEIQAIQIRKTEVKSLLSEDATPTTVMDDFHHHPFVHFACHGRLEAGKPFEAGFELHEGARLTLLEIVRAHLPTAEFAFLSACHTAEVTEGSVVEEGLHLAAAVQYCGFRSVVGTMWAMADMDGKDLAKQFYKRLFSGSSGTPYHERSAESLQFAVKKLRRTRGITLERWVNFVHYGA
jgi:CHAT domain-containing protein